MSYPTIAALDERIIRKMTRADLEDALDEHVNSRWIGGASDDQLRFKILELHDVGTTDS